MLDWRVKYRKANGTSFSKNVRHTNILASLRKMLLRKIERMEGASSSCPPLACESTSPDSGNPSGEGFEITVFTSHGVVSEVFTMIPPSPSSECPCPNDNPDGFPMDSYCGDLIVDLDLDLGPGE